MIMPLFIAHWTFSISQTWIYADAIPKAFPEARNADGFLSGWLRAFQSLSVLQSLGIPFHQKFHLARVSLGFEEYRLSNDASGYDFDFIIANNQHSGSIHRRSIIGDEIKTIENIGVEIETSNGNGQFLVMPRRAYQ